MIIEGAATIVHVVTWERNTESVNGEMFAVVGVFADPVVARRASWAEMREQLRQGQNVYGRRHADDWDVEIAVTPHQVQP